MTPKEARELERSTALFQGALVALGAQSIIDSTSLWEDVPPVRGVGSSNTAGRWLNVATAYVMRQRIRSRDMALAYYRYQRALATGKTIALPGQEPPPYVSLPELKRTFEALMAGQPPSPQIEPDSDSPVEDLPESDRIEVEVIEGLDEALEAEENEAEGITRENLRVLGPEGLERHLATPVATTEADVAEAQIDQARSEYHKKAGRRQAAAAERNVLNGGRGALFAVADKDKRALGFVRLSRTGTPCGFCAMLISRGPVLKPDDPKARQASIYSSNEGTGLKRNGDIVTYGDLDLYHDNCHCYAMPVFSLDEFKTSSVFALNRKYAELWPIVTKGLYGEQALSAWRRFIREEAKSQKSQEAAA